MKNTLQSWILRLIALVFVNFLVLTVGLESLRGAPSSMPRICLRSVPGLAALVGKGRFGSSGNGGSATAAELSYPYGVTLDSAGNIHIADSNNFAVRALDTQSAAITVTGVTNQLGIGATVDV